MQLPIEFNCPVFSFMSGYQNSDLEPSDNELKIGELVFSYCLSISAVLPVPHAPEDCRCATGISPIISVPKLLLLLSLVVLFSPLSSDLSSSSLYFL